MNFKLTAKTRFAIVVVIFFIAMFIISMPFNNELHKRYSALDSSIIIDRNSAEIAHYPNSRGYYTRPLDSVPEKFKKAIVKKEDRFFYYHHGINPASILRAVFQTIFNNKKQGGSTISQQLVKVLLEQEQERTFLNKLIETWYTLCLEMHTRKQEILTMYSNTAYFGNLAQGLSEASLHYFDKPAESLQDDEINTLINYLNNPSLEKLAKNRKTHAEFEIETFKLSCASSCQLAIDAKLTERIREAMNHYLSLESMASAQNSAVVVIKLPENELLAIVGSPNPYGNYRGYQINMAKEPRPIGSTIKPFIYLKAFEKGARPYTLVDDREYKYQTASGFGFYPKNYEGKYQGIISLHYALSNSLNVPSVKVLEFSGLENFYGFLENDLNFQPIQPLENYSLGIALGGLEMDLLTLSRYFTIFPNEGVLKPLIIKKQELSAEKRISNKDIVQLINKILSDRKTGIDQFGMVSSLNLFKGNYALKTGTSRDYHDSWVIGYTPDFLVGAWLGNSANTPTERLSGQNGAGKIWHGVMDIMLNSEYNLNTEFNFDEIEEYANGEYGLKNDDYDYAQKIMLDLSLIIFPHYGDTFLFEPGMAIPLKSSGDVEWLIDDVVIYSDTWYPKEPGNFTIKARKEEKEEEIVINITDHEL